MTFPVLSANGPSGYNLTRSLRTRASASAYLNRTLTTPTDTKKFTWSGWVKRGIVGSAYNIFFNGTPNAYTDFATFGFSNASAGAVDSLTFDQYVQGSGYIARVTTSAVYRDPSAWYHIVLVWDSANATAANRVLIYVNGSQVTSFSTATYPAQNTSSQINLSSSVNYLSNYAGTYFDGYLAEVNFIDGQALTPSSFGSTNATTGVWQPAAYTGTYGTNGFYLPFTDNSALTTSSNAGLGKDFSGNANYWVTNNISLTAGSTYDSMTDVPTLTSATAANFAVWNPNYKDTTANTTSTSNANLTTNGQFAFSSIGVTTNKFYFELTIGSANNQFVGVSASPYAGANLRAYNKDGTYYTGSGWVSYGATYTTSDVIGVALDMTNQTIEFFKNNTSQGQKTSIGLSGQTIFPMIYVESSGGITVNFGQRPFTYTPPSGFVALNTYNLPASTVPNGAAYMAATTYTGTGATQTIANTVGSASFAPDFVWIKDRGTGSSHRLLDTVRGATLTIKSDSTAAEITESSGLTAFTSTGFTLGTTGAYNASGVAFVGWQWKGGGTGVSNTNGTITSTVSANTTSGCSVIKYISNGTNGATVGHGLGVAPSLVIVKCTYPTTTQAWAVYHASLGATQYLTLQSTDAATTSSAYWNNTAPSSSVFTIGTSNDVNINSSVFTYAAYCFAAIKGFSAFGSYTGNGSTDGPFVYLGFRPRYVMLKVSSTAGYDWLVYDSSRDTYNVTQYNLRADTSDAESTQSANYLDFLSNGFKIRGSSAGSINPSQTIIYAAFAESPFQNSLAR